MSGQVGTLAPGWKRVLAIGGLLLMLPGLPAALSFFCVVLAISADGDTSEAAVFGLVSFGVMVITAGAGSLAFWHGLRSLSGRPSKSIHFPAPWVLAGVFGLMVVLAGSLRNVSDLTAGFLFPPPLMAAAILPPLAAVAWFAGAEPKAFTWRRGLMAWVGGATLGVFVAVVLELLIPILVLSLVMGLAELVLFRLQSLLAALEAGGVAEALTQPGFIYLFIQLAIIAPIAEELAKPLAVLPLARSLSRREAFLLGAAAGAGFAGIENYIYAGSGLYGWAGILLVRALGAAIHPLGAGLVALGWRDLWHGEANAGPGWLARFALAAGMHSLWNGGSLVVLTLAGAGFFGQLPPEVNILGLSAAGTSLALLLVLGLAAFWLGQAIVRSAGRLPALPGPVAAEAGMRVPDRAMAIWGLACLVAVVPVGITALQILLIQK